MKYLEVFENTSDYNAGKQSVDFDYPHVSYINDSHTVIYEKESSL